ncbi:MAG: KEOPS complex kinase/ATPase Bud32 [Candidatus Geothermarchaeales archaeon]
MSERVSSLWPIDSFIYRGAEADLYRTQFLGREAVLKIRIRKEYRNPILDQVIRARRTSREAVLLNRAKGAGVRVPLVRFVDPKHYFFVMECLHGTLLREALKTREVDWKEVAVRMSRDVAAMHGADVIHGDLTTSNVMIVGGELAYFDFGLGEISGDIEKKAVDLELLSRVMHSTHPHIEKKFLRVFTGEYEKALDVGSEVVKRFKIIRRMGRYIPRELRKRV